MAETRRTVRVMETATPRSRNEARLLTGLPP